MCRVIKNHENLTSPRVSVFIEEIAPMILFCVVDDDETQCKADLQIHTAVTKKNEIGDNPKTQIEE